MYSPNFISKDEGGRKEGRLKRGRERGREVQRSQKEERKERKRETEHSVSWFDLMAYSWCLSTFIQKSLGS